MSGGEGRERRPDAVLLLMNRSSGTGHPRHLIGQIEAALREGLGADSFVMTETVVEHSGARATAEELAKARRPRVFSLGKL